MIRQALVALGPKSVIAGVLIGGAALALGALVMPRAAQSPHAPAMMRLVLHAPEHAGYMYVSAWAEGDVFEPSLQQKELTFTRRSDEHDGCTWLGTEKLTRKSDGVYAYDYSETILACRPDAEPFVKTPRHGEVVLERWNAPAEATPLDAIQAPGPLRNPDVAVEDEHCTNEDAADDVEDAADEAEDAAEALADAQRELADAQHEIEDAMRQANDQVKAALEHASDEHDE